MFKSRKRKGVFLHSWCSFVLRRKQSLLGGRDVYPDYPLGGPIARGDQLSLQIFYSGEMHISSYLDDLQGSLGETIRKKCIRDC